VKAGGFKLTELVPQAPEPVDVETGLRLEKVFAAAPVSQPRPEVFGSFVISLPQLSSDLKRDESGSEHKGFCRLNDPPENHELEAEEKAIGGWKSRPTKSIPSKPPGAKNDDSNANCDDVTAKSKN
jgi:hypothetical protein